MTISESVNNRQEGLVSAQKRLQGLWSSFVSNKREINLSCYEFKFAQPNQVVPAMKVLYLQPHNRFGAETAHHSWAADVKEMYDWLPQQDIIKVTMEEIKCFQNMWESWQNFKKIPLKG